MRFKSIRSDRSKKCDYSSEENSVKSPFASKLSAPKEPCLATTLAVAASTWRFQLLSTLLLPLSSRSFSFLFRFVVRRNFLQMLASRNNH